MLKAGATSAVSSTSTPIAAGVIPVHHAKLRPDQSLAESDEEFRIADQAPITTK